MSLILRLVIPYYSTRMGYNQNEKEAILKYIIQNEGSTERIKGSQLWKNMEEDKVC